MRTPRHRNERGRLMRKERWSCEPREVFWRAWTNSSPLNNPMKYALNRRYMNPAKHLTLLQVLREVWHLNRKQSVRLFIWVGAALLALWIFAILTAPRQIESASDQYTQEAQVFTYEISGGGRSMLCEMTTADALRYVASHPGAHAFKTSPEQ